MVHEGEVAIAPHRDGVSLRARPWRTHPADSPVATLSATQADRMRRILIRAATAAAIGEATGYDSPGGGVSARSDGGKVVLLVSDGRRPGGGNRVATLAMHRIDAEIVASELVWQVAGSSPRASESAPTPGGADGSDENPLAGADRRRDENLRRFFGFNSP